MLIISLCVRPGCASLWVPGYMGPLQMGEGLTGIRVGQFIAMADKTIAVQPADAVSLNTFPVQSFCDADSF